MLSVWGGVLSNLSGARSVINEVERACRGGRGCFSIMQVYSKTQCVWCICYAASCNRVHTMTSLCTIKITWIKLLQAANALLVVYEINILHQQKANAQNKVLLNPDYIMRVLTGIYSKKSSGLKLVRNQDVLTNYPSYEQKSIRVI